MFLKISLEIHYQNFKIFWGFIWIHHSIKKKIVIFFSIEIDIIRKTIWSKLLESNGRLIRETLYISNLWIGVALGSQTSLHTDLSRLDKESTNFRLELIEPSALDVSFELWSREKSRWVSEERREHGSKLARLETASELKNNKYWPSTL